MAAAAVNGAPAELAVNGAPAELAVNGAPAELAVNGELNEKIQTCMNATKGWFANWIFPFAKMIGRGVLCFLNWTFFNVPVMCVLCPALALIMESISSIQEVYIDIPSHHWICYLAVVFATASTCYLFLSVVISIIVVRKQVTAAFRWTYFFRSHLMVPVLTCAVSVAQLILAGMKLDHVRRLHKQPDGWLFKAPLATTSLAAAAAICLFLLEKKAVPRVRCQVTNQFHTAITINDNGEPECDGTWHCQQHQQEP